MKKALWISGFSALLVLIRILTPERPMDEGGPGALLDAIFTAGLAFVFVVSAYGCGNNVLNWLGISPAASGLEGAVFSIPIGVGIFSYGVLAIGLAGFLRHWMVLIWAAIFVLLGVSGLAQTPLSDPGWGDFWRRAKDERLKLLVLVAAFLAAIGFIHALSPVYDQDGLMYHMQGIKYFLESGKIVLLPEIWQANGPSTLEMTYVLGLVTRSDSFGRLIHLCFAVLLVLATWSLGKRYFGDREAILAGLILAGIPTFLYLGSLAYTDLAWAVYSFLAVFALFRWMEDRRGGWIILSGILMGWALGSKYLAVINLGILAVWIILRSHAMELKQNVRSSFYLVGCAVLVASPWYIKNWTLAGNPIYPFIFGGPGWDLDRLQSLSTFLNCFGVGKTPIDFAFLPLNLFYRFDQFATLPFEIPSFFFVLAPAFFWTKRSSLANSLAWITILGAGVWSLGSQQTRFLLPAYPGLSLMAAGVLNRWTLVPIESLMKRVAIKTVLISLAICQLVFIVLFMRFFFVFVQPFAVVIGFESKDSYLRRTVSNYAALKFIQSNSLTSNSISFFWDGSGYYCEQCNLATSGQWAALTSTNGDIRESTNNFHHRGVGFILYNLQDEAFFLNHDPSGIFLEVKDFFLNTYKNKCTREIYRDKQAILFELTC